MEKIDIIRSISERTNGEIYLGVVGAVRTGKSTFIKKFIENLVVPNIQDEQEKRRCLDEIPQSSQGKMIMTTEPKFVPSNAANINIDNFNCNVRLVDCVGYIIDGATGYEDENGPRMVKTPWYDDEIPFVEAAEIGTEKVIRDHSSIGIVVTTDGSFGEISRSSYIDAEKRVVDELKSIGKPFIVILNSSKPKKDETLELRNKLIEEYNVPVLAMSLEEMNEKDVYDVLKEALYEFPVSEIKVNMPDWIACLNPNNSIKKEYINQIRECVTTVDKLRDVDSITNNFIDSPNIKKSYISNVDTTTGIVTIQLEADDNLFNEVLKDTIGYDIRGKADLLKIFQDYNDSRNEYEGIKEALKMVKATGYGVANPTLSDMKLETPEIIKQGSRYGIKLKAVAPSIHMIRVDVESTFEPIIGTEIQSKQLIDYLMKDKDTDPNAIWKSEIFGRSIDNIVKEGIQAKLSLTPEAARYKLQQTLTKLVNKGSGNLFAIVI